MLSEAEVAIVMLSGEQRSRNISREASAAKRTQAQEPSGSIWPHLTPKPPQTTPISPRRGPTGDQTSPSKRGQMVPNGATFK